MAVRSSRPATTTNGHNVHQLGPDEALLVPFADTTSSVTSRHPFPVQLRVRVVLYLQVSAAQDKQFQESYGLLRQANQLVKEMNPTKAIEAIRKGLALERAVFGQVRLLRCDFLAGLAAVLEEQGEWVEAARARTELIG